MQHRSWWVGRIGAGGMGDGGNRGASLVQIPIDKQSLRESSHGYRTEHAKILEAHGVYRLKNEPPTCKRSGEER